MDSPFKYEFTSDNSLRNKEENVIEAILKLERCSTLLEQAREIYLQNELDKNFKNLAIKLALIENEIKKQKVGENK